MKAAREAKKCVDRRPHKFRPGEIVTVSDIPNCEFSIRHCLYDSCGNAVYRLFGHFDKPISEDRLTLVPVKKIDYDYLGGD